ncbi:MAG: hypothetical protein HY322_14230 [Betaproteobacteria bacterium]|nr:hypothetical protein [Betaproteobacteria bacterium]
MKILAALLLIAALPACTVALHGHESSGGGATTTAVSSSVGASASGSSYAVRASFGRPVPPGVPGGHLSVSTGGAAAALFLGIIVVNAIDYLSSGPGGGPLAGVSANRPILHTCSCYGYRPDQDPQRPRE